MTAVKKKEDLLVILLQMKKENLFLVLFVLIDIMLFKFGQMPQKKLKFVLNVIMRENA